MEGQRERLWTPALTVGVAVVFAAAFVSSIVLAIGTCGGDGGFAYAAPASSRGKFCSNGGLFTPLLAPVLALVAGRVLAGAFRRRIYLTISVLVALILTIAPHFLANALSKECARDDPATGSYDCTHA